MKTSRRVLFAIITLIVIISLGHQPAVAQAGNTGGANDSIGQRPSEIGRVMTVVLEQPPAVSGSHGPSLQSGERAPARVTWSTIMTQTFEGTFPSGAWSTYDADGAASGEYYWDDDDYKPHNGTKSAWAAGGGANALDPAASEYANNMDSWMVYGPFNLSTCSAAAFDFYYWNSSEEGYDWFSWLASADGVNFSGEQRSGDSGGWQHESQDLAAYVGDGSVWLAFHFSSDGTETDTGPFVDDVTLSCATGAIGTAWTFMVYLDGDNELETAAIDEFLEMAAAGSSTQVNVVAQMDRGAGYDTGYGDWTATKRFYVTSGMEPTAANGTDLGELNMGDPQTLSNFIVWAKAAYPATHYALVLWDHGSGCSMEDAEGPVMEGIAFDDSSEGDSLSMAELRSALATASDNGAHPLDIVGLDACLMGTVDVDNQIRPYANIRVGSEETEPADGWPYDTILSALRASPSMSATGLATKVVDQYYTFHGGDYTQSAVNLGSGYTTLNNAVDDLAEALIANGANYAAELEGIRAYSTQFGDASYIDLADFADWVTLFITDPAISSAAAAVKSAALATVIHEHHGGTWYNATGISVYFPSTAAGYDARYDGSSGLLQFTANTHWDEFVRQYYAFLNYPSMFYKSGPADGATGLPITLTLSWGSSPRATEYHYCINTVNDGTCNADLSGTTDETGVQVGLRPSTTYYWQVMALNSYGGVEADSGTRWSFTTGALPPAFNKSTPINGATNQPLSLTLSWTASFGATNYEYCYDTTDDGTCSHWTSNGTSITQTLTGLSEFTTYYWHVRAWNPIGPRYSNGSASAFWSFTTSGNPAPFAKTGPPNGATSQPLGSTLSWETSAHATSYEYCIDTASNLTCDTSWTNTGMNTQVSPSGLSLGTAYYWQVRARYDTNATPADGGTWWSFTTGNTPAAFNKSAPANAATSIALSSTLTWDTSMYAESYEYCYGTSNSCATGWQNAGVTTSVQLSGLSLGTTYYWQVRAVNSFGTRAANSGTWWSFTTGNMPAAFNKSAPANAATGIVLSPTLTWASSAGATSYEYCYDTTSGAECSTTWSDVGAATSVPLIGLSMDTTYYWHVRAINSFGTRYANADAWWSFTTGVLPAAFNKTNPADAATSVSLNSTLSWASSSGATSYEYCYDMTNDSACTTWTGNGTSTSKALSSLSQYTTYYWHIRALNNIGPQYSNGSETAFWSFTTGGDPGPFGKSGPSNGATNQPLSLSLSWETSSNATSYEYCYGTTDTCVSGWQNVGAMTSMDLSGLSLNTTYYWQARARNSFNPNVQADGGTWWSFTTGNIPGAFAKSSPANAAANHPLNLTLTWAASSGAENYEYCLDTVGNTACDTSWVSTGEQTSADISALSAATTYYWHVRAINSFGTRASSSNTWWSFTTGNYPGAFGKSAPHDGAHDMPTSLTLTWASSTGAASYSYCVSLTDLTCDGSWINNGTATSAPISGLSLGTTYYWQVRANNGIGEKLANGGTWWCFATGDVPGTFGKSGPPDGAIDQPLSLALSWEVATNPASYSYCYDTTNDNACDGAWISAGWDTTTPISDLSASMTYYWQVKAINEFGDTPADGGTWWSFATGSTPGDFGKVSPIDGFGPLSPDSSLSWGTSAGALSYEYCFDTSDDEACDATWTSAGLNTTIDPAGIFLPGNMYYWQVRARNAIGPTYADGGGWWSFLTTPPIVGMPRSKGGQDGWVLESSELSGIGGTLNSTLATFNVGDDATRKQYRVILSFDTSGLSDTAVITSVTLKVKKAGGTGNPYATLGNIVVDVKKRASRESSALQLADFKEEPIKTAAMIIKNTPVSGWYSASLRPEDFVLVNRNGLTQFRLRFTKDDDNDAIADILKFYSGNAATAGYRPLLLIELYEP